MAEYKEILPNYMNFDDVPTIILYNIRTHDILTFAEANIDITTRTISQHLTIIFTMEDLFIGFLTKVPEIFSPKLIHHIKYQSQPYSVVAHIFVCAAPIDVQYLILKQLISDSINKKRIDHPCMRSNHYAQLNIEKVGQHCVVDFGTTSPVKFSGSFDKYACVELIKNATTQKELYWDNAVVQNFAGIDLPFTVDPNYTLMLYNRIVNKNIINGDIYKTLAEIQNYYCAKDPTATDETEIPVSEFNCLESIYLEYVLEHVVGFSGNVVVVVYVEDDIHNPVWVLKQLVHSDQRLGLLVEGAKYSTAASELKTTEEINMNPYYFLVVGVGLTFIVAISVGIFFYIRNRNTFVNNL